MTSLGRVRRARKEHPCHAETERQHGITGLIGSEPKQGCLKTIGVGDLYFESNDGWDAFHPYRYCKPCAIHQKCTEETEFANKEGRGS